MQVISLSFYFSLVGLHSAQDDTQGVSAGDCAVGRALFLQSLRRFAPPPRCLRSKLDSACGSFAQEEATVRLRFVHSGEITNQIVGTGVLDCPKRIHGFLAHCGGATDVECPSAGLCAIGNLQRLSLWESSRDSG